MGTLTFPNIYLEGDSDESYCYQESMNPVQRKFHLDSSKFRWLGGGVGGGKSVAALVEVLKQCWVYKDNYGFILRETLPELKLSAFKDFYSVCPRWLIYEENRQERWIDVLNHIGHDFMLRGGRRMQKRVQSRKLRELKGLSRIEFISFEGTIRGEKKFRSANIGWYFIEQAESAYPAIYDVLNERMRRKPSGRKGIFVSNPNGHDWLWQMFHPDSPDRRPGHAYFPIRLQDNPTLPDDYHETLKATYDDDLYKKMVEGSHEVASGAVYPELSRSIHIVDHFDPPEEWEKGVGLDHGLSNPTAFVLGAKFPKPYEGVYIYKEYQVKDEIVSHHVKVLRDLLSPQFKCFAIDPETKKHDAVHYSTVLGEYNAHGIPFRVSSNDVVAGVNRVKEYFKYDPLLKHPISDERGSARLLISSRCPLLIQQLHRYKREEQKTGRGSVDPPERFSKYNCHLADALRYLMLRFTNALTAKSIVKGFEKAQSQVYRVNKPSDLLDDAGNYSIGKLIEDSQRVKSSSRGSTTWLSA